MDDIIEKLLSERFEGHVRLDAAENIRVGGRSKVSRYQILAGPQGAPESVIIKQAVAVGREVYDPELPGGPAWRLFNEWAGLQFLTETSGGAMQTPRFYAGDRNHGLIALEDLGAGERLDHVLLGADPDAAEARLVDFAATLGRMHALTVGKQDEFERLRGSLGPREDDSPDDGERLARLLRDMGQVAGVEPAVGIDEELRVVNENLVEPGPFAAYLHHDPCPDNCLTTVDGFKLIDFEFGGFGHALMDGIYGLIHFPTCWCVNRLPEHIPPKMEAVYRTELIKGCPEAADDERFYRAVVEACAACVINSHNATTLLDDHRWGISTMWQRTLLRLDILCKLTEDYGHLKGVGETVRAIAQKLRDRWPAEADAMPFYPAFRKS
jgi:Phosphotransferase enzyme family